MYFIIILWYTCTILSSLLNSLRWRSGSMVDAAVDTLFRAAFTTQTLAAFHHNIAGGQQRAISSV